VTRHRLPRSILALVLLLAGGSAVGVGAAPAGAAKGCSRPLVIGVRGSGETRADADGYGATIAAALDAFRAATPQRFDAEAFDYPSRPITDLLDPITGRTRFLAGVEKGIRTFRRRLREVAEECPRRPLVVLAYSQGALVVNRAIVELDQRGSKALRRVVALGLISDPQRIAGSPFALGSANPTLSGLGAVLGAYPPDQIPTELWSATDSICVDGDVVCAWNPSPEALQALLLLPNAIVAAHTSYTANNLAALAGYNAAVRLAAWRAAR
jgi:hypothetical protein